MIIYEQDIKGVLFFGGTNMYYVHKVHQFARGDCWDFLQRWWKWSYWYFVPDFHPGVCIYQPPANAAGLCWAWDCKQHGQKHHQKQQQQQQHHSLHCQQHGEKHHQKQQQQQQQPTAAITTATTTPTPTPTPTTPTPPTTTTTTTTPTTPTT